MKKLVGTFALLVLPWLVAHASTTALTITETTTSGSKNAQTNNKVEKQRIVSAGNGVTELIYALGAGDQVVAVDVTSNWPSATHKLPKLGYHKQMSAEGILAMAPTLLVGTEDMGPPSTISQLKSAGVQVESMPLGYSQEMIKYRIEYLAKLLNREEQGQALWQSIKTSLDEAQKLAESRKEKPRVLFMLAMGGRTPSVSGDNTAANALIELAGGNNVAADSFSSYKPLSNEALLELSPDFILYADRGEGMTADQLMNMQPVLKQTPAGKKGQLVAIDGNLLLGGLGPRTGETAIRLAKVLYQKSDNDIAGHLSVAGAENGS